MDEEILQATAIITDVRVGDIAAGQEIARTARKLEMRPVGYV
jgi:ribosomal protein S28E/S33